MKKMEVKVDLFQRTELTWRKLGQPLTFDLWDIFIIYLWFVVSVNDIKRTADVLMFISYIYKNLGILI